MASFLGACTSCVKDGCRSLFYEVVRGYNHEWKDLGGHWLLIGRSISVFFFFSPSFMVIIFAQKKGSVVEAGLPLHWWTWDWGSGYKIVQGSRCDNLPHTVPVKWDHEKTPVHIENMTHFMRKLALKMPMSWQKVEGCYSKIRDLRDIQPIAMHTP